MNGPQWIGDDRHDRAMVAAVHPPEWRNPAPQDRYHLVVIGAGTAGLVTAAGAAGLGAKVALIERHLMGGDCLTVGCVPSKGVLAAARAWHQARQAHERFGGPRVGGGESFSQAMERMRRVRAAIAPHDGAARFGALGVDVFFGAGRFLDDRTIEVAGQRLNFRRAVIATGARAACPSAPWLEQLPWLTNESIFTLTELPPRLLVLGSGPIGCELAQAFARFGSQVTLLVRGAEILSRESTEAARIVRAALERDGVTIVDQTEVLAASHQAGEVVLQTERAGRPQRLVGDRLLVAIGRAPNVEGLGLEQAGVRTDHAGVLVDQYLRSSNRRIYAAGDVCSPDKFTHTADAHARIVIRNALFDGIPARLAMQRHALLVPRCTYTDPELAQVGLSRREAEARGIAYDTITIPLAQVDRAILDDTTDGLLEVIHARGRGTILGATLVAPHAGETISELTLAIRSGQGLGALASTIHPYPTTAEVIRKAGDTFNRSRLTPRARSVFHWLLRVFR